MRASQHTLRMFYLLANEHRKSWNAVPARCRRIPVARSAAIGVFSCEESLAHFLNASQPDAIGNRMSMQREGHPAERVRASANKIDVVSSDFRALLRLPLAAITPL